MYIDWVIHITVPSNPAVGQYDVSKTPFAQLGGAILFPKDKRFKEPGNPNLIVYNLIINSYMFITVHAYCPMRLWCYLALSHYSPLLDIYWQIDSE